MSDINEIIPELLTPETTSARFFNPEELVLIDGQHEKGAISDSPEESLRKRYKIVPTDTRNELLLVRFYASVLAELSGNAGDVLFSSSVQNRVRVNDKGATFSAFYTIPAPGNEKVIQGISQEDVLSQFGAIHAPLPAGNKGEQILDTKNFFNIGAQLQKYGLDLPSHSAANVKETDLRDEKGKRIGRVVWHGLNVDIYNPGFAKQAESALEKKRLEDLTLSPEYLAADETTQTAMRGKVSENVHTIFHRLETTLVRMAPESIAVMAASL